MKPRQLLPLQEPSQTLLIYPPILPSNNVEGSLTKSSRLHELYNVSSHIVPAAFPRTSAFVPLPSEAQKALSNEANEKLAKESRRRRTQKLVHDILETKKRDVTGESNENASKAQSRLLWNTLKRYERRKSLDKDETQRTPRKRFTLLLLHANGFPKEIWEPFIYHLTSSLEQSGSDVCLDEVWSFEAVQHGDAALINEYNLGLLYDWVDNARDVTNFLLHYLPPPNDSSRGEQDGSLPLYPPRVSDEVLREREERGFVDRELVVVGHSLGGATAALAALNQPQLFSSIIFVDPVIIPPYVDRSESILKLVTGAVSRRDHWSSREEAKRLFLASPFFSAWDPEVLDAYVDFGLTSDSKGVRLKMPGIQEAVVFADNRSSVEAFELLMDLDERIELRWIMQDKEPLVGTKEAIADVVWRRPKNSSNTIMPYSHLIAQEAPKELGVEISSFLCRKYGKKGSESLARL